MSDESRVLAVLPTGETMVNQTRVIREARMDTSRCLATLTRLVDLGLVERRKAQAAGRGRPSLLYRRIETRGTVA